MIDFKLDEKGDLSLELPEQYNRFRMDFATDYYPKMRIVFNGEKEETESPAGNLFSINFFVDENDREVCKYIETVKDDKEKAQSVAIRLKTELDELSGLYYNFGSKISDYRHLDLYDSIIWRKIEEAVKEAVADIIPSDKCTVEINRADGSGNFVNETLEIKIYENGERVGEKYYI